MRHERPLLVKDGIMGEKWLVNLACDSDFHVNHRVILHALRLYFPSKGKHAVDFFSSGDDGWNQKAEHKGPAGYRPRCNEVVTP
jgi:hypothetical protein